MAKHSAASRAADERDIDVDYSERSGFLVGKSAALADWQFRKLQNEGDFQRLVWRLQAKKYWAAKDPERKARIRAYRAQWAKDNAERYREAVNACKRRRRTKPEVREAEAAERRAKRAEATQRRREQTVYTCRVCGSYWSPLGRLPARPPTYCSQPCRSRENYRRARARGKR